MQNANKPVNREKALAGIDGGERLDLCHVPPVEGEVESLALVVPPEVNAIRGEVLDLLGIPIADCA